MLLDLERKQLPFSNFFATQQSGVKEIPFSESLKEMQEYGVQGSPCVATCAARGLNGYFCVFDPIPGFHFGFCGPLSIKEPAVNGFYCDKPMLVFMLILSGETCYRLGQRSAKEFTLRKNMYCIGRWSNQTGRIAFPCQEGYAHLGFMIEEEAVERHFGSAAFSDISKMLKQAFQQKGRGTSTIVGMATPDVISAGKQLLKVCDMEGENTMPLRCATLDFLGKLMRCGSAQTPPKEPPLFEQDVTRLTQLKRYIDLNFLTLGSLEDICRETGMSISKANKGFKQIFGITITQYRHSCKMVYSHEMLTSRKLNVSQCAFEVGYSNIGHFIAAYKKHYGITPKQSMQAA